MTRRISLGLFLTAALFHPAYPRQAPFAAILGIAQDAGYPHAGCRKECCLRAWKDPSGRRMVSSLAIVDPATHERWIIDATPDFTSQLKLLEEVHPSRSGQAGTGGSIASTLGVTGIVLTHAHIGHYTGLMFLGREGIGAMNVPVYAMPRMREFLRMNGPWSQLVALNNIELRPLEQGVGVRLNERISITPLQVPHRDEYSETIGVMIQGPNASLLFIPDIDKWEKWETRIEDLIARVDYALLDGTFFEDGEIPGRSMSEIPHPFITETLRRIAPLPSAARKKVSFIHLNHTNPALNEERDANRHIETAGSRVAREGEKFGL